MPILPTIHQGASYAVLLTLAGPGGVPFDLTAYEVLGQIKARYADAAPAASFTMTPTGSPGEVTASLSRAVTKTLVDGSLIRPSYVYDFVLRRLSDDERIWLFGEPIMVHPGVTL